MNGRIYDPLLGRFLSADILVQFPGSLQSYNRYTYVNNNPLSYTDPTGFVLNPNESEEKKKKFEEYQKNISKLGYNVTVQQNKEGNVLFVFTKIPAQAAAAKTSAAADNAQPTSTPTKDRVASQSTDSNASGGTGSGTGKVDSNKQPTSEVNDKKEGTPAPTSTTTPTPKKGVSVGWGASGTIFVGLYGTTFGISGAAISSTDADDIAFQISISDAVMVGGGLAIFPSTGPSFGTTAMPEKSGIEIDPFRTDHAEAGLGLGNVVSASYDWNSKEGTHQVTPPTAFKFFSPKDGVGGAAYAGKGKSGSITLTIKYPVPKTFISTAGGGLGYQFSGF